MSEANTSSLLLSWSHPIGIATGYSVKAKNSSNHILFSRDVKEAVLSVRLEALPAGTKLRLSVVVLGHGALQGDYVIVDAYTMPEMVLNLSASSITENSVLLSWDRPVGNLAFYHVSSSTTGLSLLTTKEHKKLSDLTPGGTYMFEVITGVLDKSIWSAPANITVHTKPSMVSNVDVSEANTSSLLLSWSRPRGIATSYRVKAKDSSNHVLFSRDVKEAVLSVRLEALPAGTKLRLSVVVLGHGALQGNYIIVDTYTMPEMVLNLRASLITEHSVLLSWDRPVGNLAFYHVSSSTTGLSHLTTKEHNKLTDLTPGGTYMYEVITGVKDNSIWSAPANITVYTKPGMVSNVAVSEANTSSLLISWSRPKGFATGYRVKAKNSSNHLLLNMDLKVAELSVRLGKLPAGAKLLLSVAALGQGALQGDYVIVDGNTGPVSHLRLISTSGSSIDATWVPPQGGYQSFIVSIQGEDSKPRTETTEERMLTLRDLFSAVKYTVTVTTISGDLMSQPVIATNFTIPHKPGEIKIHFSNKSHVTLGWDPPSNTPTPPTAPSKDVDGYRVRYQVTYRADFWDHQGREEIDNNLITVGGLRGGTTYVFEVKTLAGELKSLPVRKEQNTKEEKREVSLSVLCSSTESLHCDKASTKAKVLAELKKYYGGLLDGVFWELKWREQ